MEIYEDYESFKLEVHKVPQRGYNVMIDNLGGKGVTPENHQFAALFVLKDDRSAFIAQLADALGVHVVVGGTDDEPPSTAVDVNDNALEDWFTAGESRYTVSGDIHDFLTEDEIAAVCEMDGIASSTTYLRSVNYIVAEKLDAVYETLGLERPDFELDPEHSCFFAYTSDKKVADTIAAWINEKRFLA